MKFFVLDEKCFYEKHVVSGILCFDDEKQSWKWEKHPQF